MTLLLNEMVELTTLPNIGATLAKKLIQVGITTPKELAEAGSENALVRLSALEGSAACLNMLFALEGAIQGIRWHQLDREKKEALKEFYRLMKKDEAG